LRPGAWKSIAEGEEELGGPPSTDRSITQKTDRRRDRCAHIAESSLPVPPTSSAISAIASVHVGCAAPDGSHDARWDTIMTGLLAERLEYQHVIAMAKN
jgi:hypothetical protein